MRTSTYRHVQMVALILVLAIHKEAAAVNHAIGGSEGWDESTDFNSWASAQTFRVGDQLDFKYSMMHSVVELPNEDAYKSCSIGNAVNSLNGGSNTIKLDKTGTRYFACGTSGHCEEGMKVKITVVAADASPSSSSTATTHAAHSTSQTSGRLHLLSLFVMIGSFVLYLVQHIM